MIPGAREVPGQASGEDRVFLGKGSLVCRGLVSQTVRSGYYQRLVSQAAEEEGSTNPSDPGRVLRVQLIL